MPLYFIIVENTNEVQPIGHFYGLTEAHNEAAELCESIAHDEGYIISSLDASQTLLRNLSLAIALNYNK